MKALIPLACLALCSCAGTPKGNSAKFQVYLPDGKPAGQNVRVETDRLIQPGGFFKFAESNVAFTNPEGLATLSYLRNRELVAVSRDHGKLRSTARYQAGKDLYEVKLGSSAIENDPRPIQITVYLPDGRTPAPEARISVVHDDPGAIVSDYTVDSALANSAGVGHVIELEPGEWLSATSEDARYHGLAKFREGAKAYKLVLNESGGYSSTFKDLDENCMLSGPDFPLSQILSYHAAHGGGDFLSFRQYLERGIISKKQFATVERGIHCFGTEDSQAQIVWGKYVLRVRGLDEPLRFIRDESMYMIPGGF